MSRNPNQNPKNIVICCDGTGNQFGENNSNIVKLYTALMVDNDQVAYYHPGVGTMGSPLSRNPVEKALSVLKGLAFAAGFMENVEDAYRYLMDTYNDGDRIYLFGFSRGAYTVRALAALLQSFGLLCRGNQGHIPYIVRMFNQQMADARSQSKRDRSRGAERSTTSIPTQYAFKQTFSHDVILHFVGLFDTVSSVGWIAQPLRLLYSAQNPIMRTGRHAVSIDERRCYYQDNLWGDSLPASATPALFGTAGAPDEATATPAAQDVLQVWFAGVHSDIGGSYTQDESELPNHSLRWMIDQAASHGLLIHPDRERLIFGEPTEKTYAAASLFKRPHSPGMPHTSLKGWWWLLECFPHRYYVMDTEQERWRIPFGSPRTLPTGAVVHPSVMQRLLNDKLDYDPKNLARTCLRPHPGQQPGTTADLRGYYLHEPWKQSRKLHPETESL